MPYNSNPFMPKVRRLAVNEVKSGRLSQAQAARKYGVNRSTIGRWISIAPKDHRVFIETKPSRPKFHPHQLSQETVDRIVSLRKELNRCAPVIHAHLVNERLQVSLSSVGRVLAREGLTHNKKRAKWGSRIPRPLSDAPGSLVQVDTMHVVKSDYSRFYVFAVIDTFSRLGYAEYSSSVRQKDSIGVVKKAQDYFGFTFSTVQSDNGPEFRNGFEFHLKISGMQVRHSRVRRPNDNAHVERFIRTLQDECLGSHPQERSINKKLSNYIDFYNEKRLHLSLNLNSPRQFVAKLVN